MKIHIAQGDVTIFGVDAVVNAANTALVLGGGVAGSIRKRGGPEIQKECDLHGPVSEGEVAMTGAGNLKAAHILHAATMRPGGFSSVAIIAKATENILQAAQEKKLNTIAMPAIGCGIGGVEFSGGVRVILGILDKYQKRKAEYPQIVYFVSYKPAEFLQSLKIADEIGMEYTRGL